MSPSYQILSHFRHCWPNKKPCSQGATTTYLRRSQSHVRVSFDEPEHTGDTTAIGAMRTASRSRMAGIDCRYYQASSSEMFGASPPPQSEATPFYPRSPYGAAKVYAYWVTRNYRETYGMFAANGILFNHESPRRGEH